MSDLEWTEDGAPRSRRFDDVYFSRADGLAESRTVFLQGCGLPDAWRGRERFTVAELGFGTGLNMLALLDMWRRERPSCGRLHVFSIEAYPMRPDDAARALSAWPELADLAAPLLARWPQAKGVRRVDWPALGATLDVAVGEVEAALAGWDGQADAWFLDGFSPARNPEMWRGDVLRLVAARSTPGARVATFSVAGSVRRGLEAQGFAVERRPGHAGKRQRLEGVLTRAAGSSRAARPGRVLVIGGGIAAASLARALRAHGAEPIILGDAGRGASGAPAALVTPRYGVTETPDARFFAQAFRRAVDLYTALDRSVLSRGVRRLGTEPERARFERLAASALFAPGEVAFDADGPALVAADALVIEPRAVIDAWLGPANDGVVVRLEPSALGWIAYGSGGGRLAEAETVVVAGGFGAAALSHSLPLTPVRGQVSIAPGVVGPALEWGGYCAPSTGGLLFGATHDRSDPGDDLRPADHARNLETLRRRDPSLAQQAEATVLTGWAAVRAATPDRLPVAGPVPESTESPIARPGLYVLGGLGSRGFTTAPLLAEHLAACIVGAPSALPLDLSAVVQPARFAIRAQRRGGRRPGPVG